VGRHAGHLQREVDLDRRRQIRFAAFEQTETAILVLASSQVGDRATLGAAVDAVDEVMQQQRFGGQRPVGLELTDPVTIGRLARQEVVLGARDRLVQSRHDPKC
jgi:hypothetical protein